MPKRSLSTKSSDPFAVALDHLAWCRLQSISLRQLQQALGREHRFTDWYDALIGLARLQSLLVLRHPELRQDKVTIEPGE